MNTRNLRYVLSGEDRVSPVFQRVRGEIAATTQNSLILRNTLGPLGAQLAGVFTIAAVGAWVNRVVEGVDALNDLKDATGASIENLSALEDIALRTGTSLDTAGAAVLKLNQALNAASDPKSSAAQAIKALGLSVEELKRLDPVLALQQVGVALGRFEDDGNKGRIVLELLGRSAKDLAPVLNDLAAAGKLQATVTTEQAAEAEKLRKEWAALQKDTLDLSRALAGPLVSSINETIALFREGRKEGKGFFEILRGQQMKILGLGETTASLDQMNARMRELNSLLDTNRRLTLGIGQAPKLEAERAALQAQIDAARDNAKSAFLRGDKDTGPGPRPSLPESLGGKSDTAALAAAKKAAEERRKLAEFAAEQLVRLEDITAQETAEAWSYVNKQVMADDEARAAAFKLQWQQVFDEIDAEQERAIAEGQAFLDSQAALKKNSDDTGKQLGLVFSSAASDALRDWQGVSNLIKSIGIDIAQLLLKKSVTDPLAKYIDTVDFGGLGKAAGGLLSGLFGGGRASGGPVSAGRFYEVNERDGPGELLRVGGRQYLMPRQDGTVVPQAQGGTAGGGTNVFHIDARGADQGVELRIRAGVEESVRRSVAAVQAQANRGGGFARSMGRA